MNSNGTSQHETTNRLRTVCVSHNASMATTPATNLSKKTRVGEKYAAVAVLMKAKRLPPLSVENATASGAPSEAGAKTSIRQFLKPINADRDNMAAAAVVVCPVTTV